MRTDQPEQCAFCPLGQTGIGRAGLLWIGEAFYPTPADWIREARTMGVSRRISAVPKGFELGKTWVFVAHRKALADTDESGATTYTPAVFHAFKPTAIEYVVKGNEPPEALEKLEKRGITPVRVLKEGELDFGLSA